MFNDVSRRNALSLLSLHSLTLTENPHLGTGTNAGPHPKSVKPDARPASLVTLLISYAIELILWLLAY